MLYKIINDIIRFFQGTVERPSPSDIIPKQNISFDENEGCIKISLRNINIPLTKEPVVWYPDIPDTNSMDGVFDYGNNNILIAGADEIDHKILIDNLMVGDIAVFRTPTMYAIHRIIEIDTDGEGRYFRFKGDNNASTDLGRIRDSQIEWISVGVIY